MKNVFLITLVLIFCQITVSSQSCLPNGISFYNQEEIDSFQTNYPNCTEIEGYVYIEGQNITNLNGLSVLTSIGGNLIIYDCQSLSSLQGLGNLQFIGGYLNLGPNAFSNLEGLQNLEIIAGDFTVAEGENLDNLMGLENLQTIGGSVNFGAVTMGGAACTFLTSLTGLENLNSIGGDLNFYCNYLLEELSGLSGLTQIGGDLWIFDNPVLQSLAGLENIEAGSILNLWISDNYLLSTCEVQSICDYLSSPNGTIYIKNNALGCKNQYQVLDSCEVHTGIIDDIYFNNNIVLYPNPACQEVNISTDDGQVVDEVRIYTLTGQQVLKARPDNGILDISHLQSGMYIVEVTIENTRLRKKLLVQE